jgi:hypothetical protein
MKKCLFHVLMSLLAVVLPASAQTTAPTLVPPTMRAPHLIIPKRLSVAHKVPSHAAVSLNKSVAGGNWIRLNTHLLGTVGESTWVNLAQATNIRFYQTGKTPFAAVGTGSSYVSTSDHGEIQKLKAYVLAHQTR